MGSYHQHLQIRARLEAIQRQMSYMVVCVIIGSFFIFMAGYHMGKRYILEESYGVPLSDSFGDVLYTVFGATQELMKPYNEDKKERAVPLVEKTVVKAQEKSGPWYALVGRSPTLKEAHVLAALLKSYGFESSIEPSLSSSLDGASYCWYKVVVYQDRKEIDFIRALEVLKHKSGVRVLLLQKKYEVNDAVL